MTFSNPTITLGKITETVRENLRDKFFDAYIWENIIVADAQAEGIPIFQYILKNAVGLTAAEDYVN